MHHDTTILASTHAPLNEIRKVLKNQKGGGLQNITRAMHQSYLIQL